MGRELKRVALDFEWPLRKPYEGYINTFNTAVGCEHCNGNGYSKRGKELHDQWYGYSAFKPDDNGNVPFTIDNPTIVAFASRNGAVECYKTQFGYDKETAIAYEVNRLTNRWNSMLIHHLNDTDIAALIAEDRLMDFTHTWGNETGWVKKDPQVIPTAKQVNEWSLGGMGHDGLNEGIVIRAKCEAEGTPYLCEHCGGDGELWPSKEDKDLYDKWESVDPPKGEGYQMWETVSEGSPISPVFTTAEDLAAYLVISSTGVDVGTTYAQWLKFIKSEGGTSCSLAFKNGEVLTGVESE